MIANAGEAIKFGGCWSAPQVEAFMQDARIPLRLAMIDSTGSPWVASLWFLPVDGELWCATNAEAKVVQYLSAAPRCGFEIASELPPYKGVRGKGTASVVPERGGEILHRLLDRYSIRQDSRLARSLLAKIDGEVAIRLTPSRWCSWDFTARMAGASVAG